MMFHKLNRLIAFIIITTGWLSVEALDLPTKKINDKDYYYYQVESNETIYSISNKLGISKDEIIKYNPSVADGLRRYVTLYFPVPYSSEQHTTYIVKDNETLYSIARKNNLTVSELEQANPGITIIKKGQTINIPIKNEINDEVKKTPTQKIRHRFGEDNLKRPQPIKLDIEKNFLKEINIAIMLPFMLEDATPSKQALLFTDFYKGFLIAADSLRNIGTPIHISAYDTADSLDIVKEILKREELKKMNIIIAPDDNKQLELISNFCQKNNCDMLNIFSVKNDLYLTNDKVLHANIPHNAMYEKAIDYLINHLDGYTPVFVINNDGAEDKVEFINLLKSKLNNSSEHYEEIFFTAALQIEDLASLNDSTRYLFIPQSGSQTELNKIIHTLITLKDQSSDTSRIRLFGYPEWTTFRGETLEQMHQLNTFVYSRFYNEDDSYHYKNYSSVFKKWYGNEMLSTAPIQGILGFDTGMFVISSLHKYAKLTDIPLYNGIQSGFKFINPDNVKGDINETLYFIHFHPTGIIDKIIN